MIIFGQKYIKLLHYDLMRNLCELEAGSSCEVEEEREP